MVNRVVVVVAVVSVTVVGLGVRRRRALTFPQNFRGGCGRRHTAERTRDSKITIPASLIRSFATLSCI